MHQTGGGPRFRIFSEGLIGTGIFLHNPTLLLFPSTKDALISLSIDSLRF
jgi:hypothetical protein